MNNKIVLIVDDEPAMLNLLRIFFERAGFEVWEADCGTEALSILASRLPDAVVLDEMMHDITGGEVCRTIKSSSRTNSIPVIMHSAHPRVVSQRYLAEIGADDAIAKPCDTRRLIELVTRHLYASV